MNTISQITAVKSQVSQWKKEGFSIGFVPTMGFLHEGHSSLMAEAKKHHDKVVVSIFVNPTQFAPGEDLETYPRDLKQDEILCKEQGVDLIFAPTVEEMYPQGFATSVLMGGLTQELCGKSRPTHFAGVCLVVSKLFHIVTPDKAYFGEKDAQQLSIICQMVRDLNMDVEIVPCPIIREADGLAKSSRNAYLNPEQRKAALILSQSLNQLKKVMESGETDCKILKKHLADAVSTEPLGILDYGEIVDWYSLQPVEKVEGKVLVALAVHFGNTRLIDNFTFEKEGKV